MIILSPWTAVSTPTLHITHMTIATKYHLLTTLTNHKHKHSLRHSHKLVIPKKEDIPRLLQVIHFSSMIIMVSQSFINNLLCIKHTHKRGIPNNQLLMANSRCNQPLSTATPCMTPQLNKLTHHSNTSKIYTKKTNQRTIETKVTRIRGFNNLHSLLSNKHRKYLTLLQNLNLFYIFH